MWQVSVGHHGREALKGEFEGTSAIYSITPEFVPKPIAWGTYKSSPDTHFYLCEFYDLVEELPDPGIFCARLAELHRSHSSPNGKYGFHVVTYNGDLPQENGYTDSWEEFFANGLRHMFKLNLERGGPSEELERLSPDMFGKVIPRLLRPLETGGNSIKPSLVHGDLWCGNASVDQKTDKPLIFDPSCFWAHNECMISIFLHVLVLRLMALQMSLGIGVRNAISFHAATSMLTIRTFPKLPQKRTTTIAMPFMLCRAAQRVLFRVNVLTVTGGSICTQRCSSPTC